MRKEELLASLKKIGFSEKIISAFAKVKREDFVLPEHLSLAYEDNALPIGHNQTISQPYTIATMFSILYLREGQKVLEIGSGSGYALALMSEIVGSKGQVYGLEIIRDLADKSKKALRNYNNVKVYCQDGHEGFVDKAPFDRILISAALEQIPFTILKQLKNNGIIVAPIGTYDQSIVAFRRHGDVFAKIKEIPGFVFVRFV